MRVCHQCLYGEEYNRQKETEYLSWVTVNNLQDSEGFKNFRSQPGKDQVLNPKPETQNPKPETRNLKPET